MEMASTPRPIIGDAFTLLAVGVYREVCGFREVRTVECWYPFRRVAGREEAMEPASALRRDDVPTVERKAGLVRVALCEVEGRELRRVTGR